MIFYHVLAHIDFFQNNLYFRLTWDYDLNGQALADKRLIARLRSEKGRWVDYVIEFGRAVDNIVGYFDELSRVSRSQVPPLSNNIDYYFDTFLQSVKKAGIQEYVKEVERYNRAVEQYGELGERTFIADTLKKHSELDVVFSRQEPPKTKPKLDLLQHLMEYSPFLNRDENKWMKSVLEIVRNTSVYFQPQIRTKIMNEGWASYWHEKLFLLDDRIREHEVDFARIHAGVTSLPRVGLNPYALGMRLFSTIDELAEKGRRSLDYQLLRDIHTRERYDKETGGGLAYIFKVREDFCDFTFINTFVDQDFVNRHRLFVVDRRLDHQRMVWQYYVKSRKAEDYRQMLLDTLYHPPRINIGEDKVDGSLYLTHRFEGKPLVKEFIANTMMGIEYLWGGPVQLETSEVVPAPPAERQMHEKEEAPQINWQRVLYRMEKKKLSRTEMGRENSHD